MDRDNSLAEKSWPFANAIISNGIVKQDSNIKESDDKSSKSC
jgi:hypothetical protein